MKVLIWIPFVTVFLGVFGWLAMSMGRSRRNEGSDHGGGLPGAGDAGRL